MPKVYCTSFESKIGVLYVASTEQGVCKISIPRESRKDFFAWLTAHFDDDDVIENKSRNKGVIDELTRYFNGKLVAFHTPLHHIGTPFQIRVWKELTRIPYGTTITYDKLARRVGVPRGFQAVGQANSMNPIPIVVPCHRVIGKDGSLVGYSGGLKTKEFLLRLEGALLV
ncbi:MAG: methylated-DNA--[protein]-cysteine S-methyltransferase [Bacteroidota bacterium]